MLRSTWRICPGITRVCRLSVLGICAIYRRFGFRDKNPAPPRILISAVPCYTPVPASFWSSAHTRHAAIFTVVDWKFWPINLGSPICMVYCIIDYCVTLSPSVTNSHHSGDWNSFKSLYPNRGAIVRQADTKITHPHIPHVGINLLFWYPKNTEKVIHCGTNLVSQIVTDTTSVLLLCKLYQKSWCNNPTHA